MNNTDPQIRFQELSEFFTSDAWQLIDSFLNSLQKKINQFNISKEDSVIIINGILEFIQEFSEDYKGKTKITFNETLSLIHEIGSPSDILQSLDLPIEQIISDKVPNLQQEEAKAIQYSNRILCKNCYWSNELNSRFCDNCGTQISELEIDKKAIILPKLPQEVIDSPYISSFMLTYLTLIISGILAIVINYSFFPEPNSIYIPDLYKKLNDISTGMVIPAIIVGFILGFIIRRLYSAKLAQYKYDIHLIQLQKYFTLGIVITTISIWLCFIYIPIKVTRDEFILIAIFLVILSILLLILLYRWNFF